VPTVAKIQRLGHVVLKTPHYAEAVRFFRDVLNFRISDEVHGAITFMRAFPNPLHHSFGIGRGAKPGLHHVHFMVTEVDDIGRAMWRFQRNQIPVVNGPGRHPPSGSMFYYFLDPDELTIEYSFGMEEFPEVGARKPRILEPGTESLDFWGSPTDPRKSAIGEIEPA
jgi:2,3-dihydroxy-p-cumate/2,3-dihydroxybenzoate 3,4-dioxygenase